eukprot:Nitzschia sp. Nitz4//scaffold184_size43902//31395//32789//NITZ4_007286-RA/size43902-processed-gene-0.16-mRNA-1//-1//CDS//3329539663//2272//frame0
MSTAEQLFLLMPLKVPTRFDLMQPLSFWIDEHRSDVTSSPQCRQELLRLSALRNCLSESLMNSHATAWKERALDDCCEYYATLQAFAQHDLLPLGSNQEEEHRYIDEEPPEVANIDIMALTWKEAFLEVQARLKEQGSVPTETHTNFLWDRICTLWNVVALWSYQVTMPVGSSDAATDILSTKEGCKSVISALQLAASTMVYIKELLPNPEQIEDGALDVATVDFSNAMLTFWEKIFLAQAQYAVYKMANLPSDNDPNGLKRHSTLAYLIQGAAQLYNEALVLAKDSRLVSEVQDQSQYWARHCKELSLLCQARASFHLSIDHRMQQETGKELARLHQCQSQLKECVLFARQQQQHQDASNSTEPSNPSRFRSKKKETIPAKPTSTTVHTATWGVIQALQQLVHDRYERASQDNRSIYLQEVPKDLPEIRSQILVKTQQSSNTSFQLPPSMLESKVALFKWKER